MPKTPTTKRFAEIDFMRGIAIILMVVFHIGFSLEFFEMTQINVSRGVWRAMALIIQYIFILTTGMTLSISYWRRMNAGKRTALLLRIDHALKIFTLGMVITFITWLILDPYFVKFGILHFYGIAMILTLPLLRFKGWNAVLGGLVLLATIPLGQLQLEYSWLFPLGLTEPEFYSLDYFPLFPWYGLFLIGTALGVWLYSEKGRRFKLRLNAPKILRKPLEWMGRRSLFIYLIHQPVIAALLFLLMRGN